MQLGIEAARDGNKEEARNLFRLLTLQDPANAQAWLWLAGVAENREERQASLERVVELEPTNEMALKGLQALGVTPGSRAATPAPEPPPAPVASPAAVVPSDDPFGDDDDPFAELNNLSDVMADSEGPVRRNEPLPPPVSLDDDLPSPVMAASSSSTGRDSGRSSSTGRDSGRSSNRRSSPYDDVAAETVPARRGISPLLAILMALVGILLVGLLVIFFFFRDPGPQVATQPPPTIAAPTSQLALTPDSLEPTSVLGMGPGTETGTETETSVPSDVTSVPVDVTTEPVSQPTTPPPSDGDLAQANPVVVAAGTPLQSAGWSYDFNQPTYAAPIVGPLKQYQSNNGRFVVVLVFVSNTTGTTQSIPADFFVLKDAQGRIWQARPEVSDAYVNPGVNADQSHSQPIPPDGLTYSVALIFDVAPDATNLVFFARTNPAQGWLILSNV
ncbi:TPR repeat-containing protein [Oscillochloris trichoides DG-6]|uniref:TPR repeat-containing protein n=1 Tax=Oscillochloris trichoides DG-6 TaxID=765420 RepID=E1IAU6_9CHLR|nr:TPR repeat-containing protein [Oscillochloris trichoides DG-6]